MKIALTSIQGALLIDSRTLAEKCEIQHESIQKLLSEHRQLIEEEFSTVRFEIGPSNAKGGGGDGQRFALLTEDQATFLITLTRNTRPVIQFKAALVKAFREARSQLEEFSAPKTFAESLRALADTMEMNESLMSANVALAAINERMEPKEALFDVAMSSRDLLGMNEVAKLLGIGEKKLFEFLRGQKILRNGPGRNWHNTPFQSFIDSGYFKVLEFPFNTRDHGPKINLTTKVYQRGVEFIRRKLA